MDPWGDTAAAAASAWEDSGPEPPSGLTPREVVAFQQSGPAARKQAGITGWDVLLGVDASVFLLLIIGGLLLASTQPAGSAAEGLTTQTLWLEIGFSFVLLTIIPLAWVAATRREAYAGTLRYLGLYNLAGSLRAGALWALAMLGGTVALAYGYEALGGSTENPALDAMVEAITWPTALGLALAAGIGEEIFFRGILQKRLGLWGQALLFGLAHASYATVLQVVLPFGLGLFFGYLVRRGGSLWVPITAHVLFDVVAIGASKLGA